MLARLRIGALSDKEAAFSLLPHLIVAVNLVVRREYHGLKRKDHCREKLRLGPDEERNLPQPHLVREP